MHQTPHRMYECIPHWRSRHPTHEWAIPKLWRQIYGCWWGRVFQYISRPRMHVTWWYMVLGVSLECMCWGPLVQQELSSWVVEPACFWLSSFLGKSPPRVVSRSDDWCCQQMSSCAHPHRTHHPSFVWGTFRCIPLSILVLIWPESPN